MKVLIIESKGVPVAQKVQYILISDVSGKELGEDGQTIKFGFLGVDYELDVSQDEADEFVQMMEKYVNAARRVGGRRQSDRSGSADRARMAQIREWARENGIQVSSRGRIAQHVIDAYESGQPGHGQS